MTTMKLSRRLSYHLSSGAPKIHHHSAHKGNLKRDTLVENTEVLAVNQDHRRLPILEALFIKELSPNLNTQTMDLEALPSVRRSTLPRRNNADDVTQQPTNEEVGQFGPAR